MEAFMRKILIPLKYVIAFSVTIVFVIFFVIMVLLYRRDYNNIIDEQSKKNLSLLSSKVEENLSGLFSNVQTATAFYGDYIEDSKVYDDETLTSVQSYTLSIAQRMKKEMPQISQIYYGDLHKRTCGYILKNDGSLHLFLQDKRNDFLLTFYDGATPQDNILQTIKNFDPTTRPWYQPVSGNPVQQWSDVYVSYGDVNCLSLTSSRPILKNSKLMGVVGMDINLNEINNYLHSLDHVGSGVIYLVNKKNQIIAWSTTDQYTPPHQEASTAISLTKAADATDPLIHLSASYIVSHSNAIDNVFTFTSQGNIYYGTCKTLEDPSSLGLRIITVLPEKEITGNLLKGEYTRITLLILLFIISILLILGIISRLLKPIRGITIKSLQVMNHNFDPLLNMNHTIISELREVTDAFNAMLAKINASFEEITANERNLVLAKKEIEDLLMRENERLEALVNEKTNELNTTLKELMAKEKMASLGNLVAGISHEISTPLGVAVSASSYLRDENTKFIKTINDGDLTKQKLSNYIDVIEESTNIITTNLERASNLVTSFKKISVNQSAEAEMNFNFYENLQSVLLMLKHEYKKTRHSFDIQCPEDLLLRSFPGAYSQIFTNLIMNSLIHGFRYMDEGKISIHVTISSQPLTELQVLHIEYRDNGVGIPPENLAHVFDPFFTTTRGSGRYSGSGLGLSIVYNLVTSTLNGSITCESEALKGVLFIIETPIL
jgi:signal transduction histidine kinase